MKYRIEAANQDSSTADYAGIIDEVVANGKYEAARIAGQYHYMGYWVDIYDNDTNELLAGPFSPELPTPAIQYIL